MYPETVKISTEFLECTADIQRSGVTSVCDTSCSPSSLPGDFLDGHMLRLWGVNMLRSFFVRGLAIGAAVVQYGCIAHCTLEFVGDFVVCSGPSMQPTIHPNDVILTEHISVMRNKVQQGDIVIARSPTNPRQFICKRVTKLEGDFIENPPPGFTRNCVPRGHVWLEGDNKENSTDSRVYGPVPYGLLRGRVFYKIWPLSDIHVMSQKGPVIR